MATYYVSTSGSDAAAGTSVGTAWATISHANSNTSVGDTVLVMADGTHNVSSELTLAAAVNWVGANSSGVVDGTLATIAGTGAGTNASVINIGVSGRGATMTYQRIEAGSHGRAVYANDRNKFHRCTFVGCDDAATLTKPYAIELRTYSCMTRCIVDGGLSSDAGARLIFGGVAVDCLFINCGSGVEGCELSTDGVAVNCVSADNGGQGFNVGFRALAVGCTAVENGDTGFNFSSNYGLIAACKSITNGAYAGRGFGTGNIGINLIAGSGATANTSGDWTGGVSYFNESSSNVPITNNKPANALDWDYAPTGSNADIDAAPAAYILNGDRDRDMGAGDYASAGGGGVFLPFLRIG